MNYLVLELDTAGLENDWNDMKKGIDCVLEWKSIEQNKKKRSLNANNIRNEGPTKPWRIVSDFLMTKCVCFVCFVFVAVAFAKFI